MIQISQTEKYKKRDTESESKEWEMVAPWRCDTDKHTAICHSSYRAHKHTDKPTHACFKSFILS